MLSALDRQFLDRLSIIDDELLDASEGGYAPLKSFVEQLDNLRNAVSSAVTGKSFTKRNAALVRCIASSGAILAKAAASVERIDANVEKKRRDQLAVALGRLELDERPSRHRPNQSKSETRFCDCIGHNNVLIGSEAHLLNGAAQGDISQHIKLSYEWLLQHLHEPYPPHHVKKHIATQSGVPAKVVDDWFVHARRKIGWNAIVNKYFHKNRVFAMDSARVALLQEDAKAHVSEELHNAFIAMEDATCRLLDQKCKMSQAAKDLEALITERRPAALSPASQVAVATKQNNDGTGVCANSETRRSGSSISTSRRSSQNDNPTRFQYPPLSSCVSQLEEPSRNESGDTFRHEKRLPAWAGVVEEPCASALTSNSDIVSNHPHKRRFIGDHDARRAKRSCTSKVRNSDCSNPAAKRDISSSITYPRKRCISSSEPENRDIATKRLRRLEPDSPLANPSTSSTMSGSNDGLMKVHCVDEVRSEFEPDDRNRAVNEANETVDTPTCAVSSQQSISWSGAESTVAETQGDILAMPLLEDFSNDFAGFPALPNFNVDWSQIPAPSIDPSFLPSDPLMTMPMALSTAYDVSDVYSLAGSESTLVESSEFDFSFLDKLIFEPDIVETGSALVPMNGKTP